MIVFSEKKQLTCSLFDKARFLYIIHIMKVFTLHSEKLLSIKGLLQLLGTILLAISCSAYAAYLSYTGQIDFPSILLQGTAVEFDEQYQLFLEEEKHRQELLQAEADIQKESGTDPFLQYRDSVSDVSNQAYERLSETGNFVKIRPVIYTYTGIENISCTSQPGGGYTVCSLSSGYHGLAVGTDGESIVLKITDGQYAYAPKENFYEGACFAVTDSAYDLRGLLSHAEYRMDFCTSENITGRSLYAAIPFLETHAAECLVTAAEQFWNDGYEIVICDAYRPITAQHALWDIVGDSTFIVDPDKGASWHNVGRAVDISLVDRASGEEVELPSPVYDFSPASFRSNSGSWTTEAQNNIRYISEVMENAGFSSVDSMWWHYEFRGQGIPLMPKSLNYTEIVYEPLC